MKLHEAIDAVLAERSAGATAREIADEIKRRGLYIKPSDGKPPLPGQISARINNKTYQDRYHKDHLDRISAA
jgi:hypothetical protein